MQKDCWKDKWVRGEQLPGGNQGHTFLARRPTDPDDQFLYVLKKLKRQDDSDRRARVYIEVTSLRVLDHPGVAKLIDTNADDFKEDVELFLVTEHIQGTDLEGYAEGKPVDLHAACDITCRILEILSHCHGRGVKHRDIKPCHVILRDGCVDDPVLIDFGLAFTDQVDLPDFQTAQDQGVGNRFIMLPEQMSAGDDKRDERSDITQCVGILFYLLTRQNPGLIQDGQGRKPHERIDLVKAVSFLSPLDLRRLKRIFDVGFNWSPAQRWQSVQTIVTELRQLFDSDDASTTSLSFTDQLADLNDRIRLSPETELLTTLQKLELHLQKSVQVTAARLSKKFPDLLSITPRGSKADRSKREYQHAWRLKHRLKPQVSVDLVINARLENAELVVGGTFANIEMKRIRLGVFDPQATELVDGAVQGVFLTVAEHVLK